jgi:hypothetical protein
LSSKNAIFAIKKTECLSNFVLHDKGKQKHQLDVTKLR